MCMKLKNYIHKIEKLMIFLMLFSVISIASLGFVSAADHIVVGSNFEDIKDTLDGSSDNDRILLGNKTYTGSGSQIRVVNKLNITVQGRSDSERAVLDARHLGRIFVVDENSTVIFKYIDFINGDSGATRGAAISTYNTIIVENCSFRNNWGESGGAIFLRPGADNSRIINSSFINNEGRYEGEDEFVEGRAVDTHVNFTSIIDCVFTGNSALSVGGAVNFASNTIGQKLIGSTFRNNHAPMGGALRSINNDLLIENCTFIDNYVNETSGGALYLRLIEITIKNCVFTNNYALNNGGAIYDIDSSSFGYLNILHCNFTNNRAANGGAVYSQSPLNMIDSNFLNNRANSDNAGGIYSANAILIQNSNFTGSTGRGLVLSGDGTIISGNNFTSNSEHAIRSNNLQNAIINNNRFVNNGGTGLYITGNKNKVYNNVFSSNNIGVNVNGNYTNFTGNIVITSNNNGVVLTGNSLNFVSNNITSNNGHGLVLNGNNPSVVSNLFVNNGNYGLFSQSLVNGVINNNVFSKNLKTGLYLQGNDNRIISNSFIVNGLGLNIGGNGNNISNNNIDGNSAQGIYLIGNFNYIRFNVIKNNKRNVIYVKGSSVVIERNNVSKNSAKGYSTIYINGNGAKILNNNILSNFYNGIELSGNSASITENTLKIILILNC